MALTTTIKSEGRTNCINFTTTPLVSRAAAKLLSRFSPAVSVGCEMAPASRRLSLNDCLIWVPLNTGDTDTQLLIERRGRRRQSSSQGPSGIQQSCSLATTTDLDLSPSQLFAGRQAGTSIQSVSSCLYADGNQQSAQSAREADVQFPASRCTSFESRKNAPSCRQQSESNRSSAFLFPDMLSFGNRKASFWSVAQLVARELSLCRLAALRDSVAI